MSLPGSDVDYLFLQVVPDRAVVSDAQTCGNLLAGVGPFAIERGLVTPVEPATTVRIRRLNPTVGHAEATVQIRDGRVRYDGDTVMAGTPFPAAPITLAFPGAEAGIFPTGHARDRFAGIEVSCVDAGMPVVLVRAADLGLSGAESPGQLEADDALGERIQAIRLEAGTAMGLGDVTDATVPKVVLVSPARNDGTLTTRSFIPRRVHSAIGVFGAVSVAAGVLADDTVASRPGHRGPLVGVEHPTGTFDVRLELDGHGAGTRVRRSTVVRTARKLFDGIVWPRPASRN